MSTTPPPPDRPTQPLRPIRPDPPVVEERYVAPAGVEERYVAPAGVDSTTMLLALEDAVGALRTWLAIVGLVAVAALGIGVYALTKANDDSDRGSRSGLASDERVSRLDDRVDRLSRQLQTLRAGSSGGDSTAELGDRLDELESTVETLGKRNAPDATQAIEDLSGRIDDLRSDVDALKQGAGTP
jgi:hypothetical protein